jgi:hypothetical protein
MIEFKDRPSDGVTSSDKDGLYFFANDQDEVQVICIGDTPEPRKIADAVELRMNRRYSVWKIVNLASDEEFQQIVLDRGYISIWLFPEGIVNKRRRAG